VTQEEAPRQSSPELNKLIEKFVGAIKDQVLPDDSILERATPRWEYRKCRNGRQGWFSNCKSCREKNYCQRPYLYLYWKENGKLKKKYIGKDPENFLTNRIEKCYSHFARLGN
jgi:hypothetical protein